jgi:branched-chain amino acid transport system substrate-binding protein
VVQTPLYIRSKMSSFSLSPRTGKSAAAVAVFAIAALVLSGCAATGDSASSNSRAAEVCGPDVGTAANPTPVAPAEAIDREVTLTLGSILPVTGSLSSLGPPEIAGVDLAVAEINASEAGVLGGNVEVFHRDSGDTTTDIATQAATELLSLNVSGIIGAASSGVSKTFIDQVTGAGVIHFSPANTSPDFSDYADDGYYWRTAPSDVLQGRVVGNRITGDGFNRVGVLYLNDAYGIGLSENAKVAIEAAGGEVVVESSFNTGDSNFSAQIDEVLAASPEAILLIAFDETRVILPELAGTKGFDGSKIYLVDGNLFQYGEELASGLLNCAVGTLPGVLATDEQKAELLGIDPALKDFSYANESYDAVLLMALAAIAGGSTEGSVIRDNLQAVSRDGTKCTAFQECAELLAAGEDIDYDGRSGPITFDENGDPTEAYVGIYQYGKENKYAALEVLYGKLD